MTDQPLGDVQAALAEVKKLTDAAPITVDPGAAFLLQVPDDVTVHVFDPELLALTPRRLSGTHVVYTGESFVTAVQRRIGETGETGIYVDDDALHLTAVLNDDIEGPDWRDYRVDLRVRPTPEWTFWTGHFAEIIEEGQPHIVSPAAADMLEMAQTFAATIDGRFAQGANLKNGSRQLTYEENITATAGKSVVVPDEFVVEVVPFLGASAVQVPCLIRYRITEGRLSIGYTILNVDEYKRDAFAEIVNNVRRDLALPDVPFVEGPAGPPRTPAPTLS